VFRHGINQSSGGASVKGGVVVDHRFYGSPF
jgi:hypothetical protein